jgi:hypothetical protein
MYHAAEGSISRVLEGKPEGKTTLKKKNRTTWILKKYSGCVLDTSASG